MDACENDRCPFCNAIIKEKSMRCASCASLIVRKRIKTPCDNALEVNDADAGNDGSSAVAPGFPMTYTGMLFFGLMVFIPVMGQLVGIIAALTGVFSKNATKKAKAKLFLLYGLLFLVLWAIALYFAYRYLIQVNPLRGRLYG